MRLLLMKRAPTLVGYLLFISILSTLSLCRVDLTSANRRPPITGLPDWSKAGYMQGTLDLPTTTDCQYTYTPQFLRDTYGLIPDDGVDDTHALEQAIYWARGRLETASIPTDGFICIQLPAGMTFNLSCSLKLMINFRHHQPFKDSFHSCQLPDHSWRWKRSQQRRHQNRIPTQRRHTLRRTDFGWLSCNVNFIVPLNAI